MTKRTVILLTSVVILVVLLIAGCVNSTAPSPSPSVVTAEASTPLEGTMWTLASLVTETGETSVLSNTTITATFKGGNVTGSSGCNHYFARYGLSDGTNISFTSLGSTVMYCTTPGVMSQETTYILLLQNATAYTIRADTLSLLNEIGHTQLVFKALNTTV